MSTTFKQQQDASYLGAESQAYLENLYEMYLEDPTSVDAVWGDYFSQFPMVDNVTEEEPHSLIQQAFLEHAKNKRKKVAVASGDAIYAEKQSKVFLLIDAYRRYGHQHAQVDPLKRRVLREVPELTWAFYGLTQTDAQTVFNTTLPSLPKASLKQIDAHLRALYASSVGAEYMYITRDSERLWVQKTFEALMAASQLSAAKKQRILKLLTKAEGLERYLHAKYVGQKRFSVEGGESLIPLIDELIQQGGQQNIKEIVIGMAHRGRLNIVVNVLGKAPDDLFKEFEGKAIVSTLSSGDVKYHQGFSSDIQTPGGIVHLALAFNPSHLEIVAPVIEGSVRARQERRFGNDETTVLPLVMHGDASFAGQGVVMETLNMSQVRGYKTGGTVHIVINNQIGFTTSEPQDARSSEYCSDIAKMIEAPVFHVNGDDPDAVVLMAKLALDYRMKFKKDIVIDLVCYRRHGHNEADEPAATQPIMYQIIRAHETTREIYAKKLVADGVLTEAQADEMAKGYRDHLDTGKHIAEDLILGRTHPHSADWTPYLSDDMLQAVNTQVPFTTLAMLAKKMFALPQGFQLQTQVNKVIQERLKMAEDASPLDWGFAETLAYASLIHEGYSVRLSGQDAGRGTFAHRHVALHEQTTDATYIPLQHIVDKPNQFTVIDSLLSEEAVLAFEYGYATAEPSTLVLWEAQFGDFANGAQVVADQFISSGQTKWGRRCGLVMLLPHGYEGMGPEHTSARLERYLQLCAEHNMQVCTPTSPAQIFHLLRRQMHAPYRKPLIVMTPKSLLRHRLAVSTMQDLANGTFQTIIHDAHFPASDKITTVILCGGKVYYDLFTHRETKKLDNVAIIRVEQLYPFPAQELAALLKTYTAASDVVWCQEEPQNQGAWYCTAHHLHAALAPQQKLRYAGRKSSASPATGYASVHTAEQNALVNQAFGEK